MSKILTNTVKKTAGWIVVFTYILVAAVAFGIIFNAKGYGAFNKSVVLDDVKTLTVSMNQHAYLTELDTVEDACEEIFADLEVSYQMKGEMTGDESELVYVFDVKTDLSKAVELLSAKFDEVTDPANAESDLAGSSVNVTSHSERNPDKLPRNTLIRTVVAGAAFAVLGLIYVAIRHKFTSGVTLFMTMGVSAALTCALILVTRLPITGSLVYVLFFNLFFTAIATMFTLNRVRELQKANEEIEAEALISEGLAIKPVLVFTGMTAVALVLVGAIATHAVRMFAIISLIGLVAGVFSSLFFAPAFYLPIKKSADAKAAQRARYDYKKGSSKEN